MAATGHAIKMNAPADAARAPCRRHVADHRDPRIQDRLGDLAHRGVEAPGRVDLQQDGGRRVVVRVLDRAAQVVGDERVDDAVRDAGSTIVGCRA